MAAEVRLMTMAAGEHRNTIARLADDLHLPRHQVGALYHAQLDKLTETARIKRYVGVLAARRTRAILLASKPALFMES